MNKQLPNRSEVEVKYTWDLYQLFNDESSYENAFSNLEKSIAEFQAKFEGKLQDAKTINACLTEVRKNQEVMVRLSAYASLHQSGDSISEVNQMRSGRGMMRFQKLSKMMSFVSTELKEVPEEVIREAISQNEDHALYLEETLEDRKYALSKEAEKVLINLSPVLNAPYGNYNRFKLADMKFNDFEVDGMTYPNSFTLFENEYEYEPNPKVRRTAYETFYAKLKEYQNGLASNYQTQLLKEKAMAEIRGFKSVFDYLLHGQKVPRAFMDRQIDLIMENLAPYMRKYAKLLQKVNGLDKMTYADLKIAVDHDFEPKVTIEESKDLLMDGLSIMGPEYLEIVRRSFDERWIDFPQNQGKSTGGFCSSPYGANSYILINWNGQMDEVMVLAHEIGHAGHFQYANKYQNIFNTRPSLYFIEAPSTTNELIMSRHLANKAKDLRTKRWIKSVMISRTYYHNFVTHLLEAAFQREVYEKMDKGEPLSANVLNNIKLTQLRKFWGDAVEIPDWAGLTWMRQPHYFMGLYPYTYSAGLTLGTLVSKKIFEGVIKPESWIEVLKAGGTKKPLELAMMVGIDLTTDKPLNETIEFIGSTIEEIIEMSENNNF